MPVRFWLDDVGVGLNRGGEFEWAVERTGLAPLPELVLHYCVMSAAYYGCSEERGSVVSGDIYQV